MGKNSCWLRLRTDTGFMGAQVPVSHIHLLRIPEDRDRLHSIPIQTQVHHHRRRPLTTNHVLLLEPQPRKDIRYLFSPACSSTHCKRTLSFPRMIHPPQASRLLSFRNLDRTGIRPLKVYPRLCAPVVVRHRRTTRTDQERWTYHEITNA